MAKPPVVWDNVNMLTPGMKNLGNQFNERWPNRYGDSDGAVGDYIHTQGTSGHNPDDTVHNNAEWDSDSDTKSEIRAIDVDSTLNDSTLTTSTDPQAQMQVVIDHMRKLPNLSSVIRYMIFDGKKYPYQTGFKPEPYTGASAHTEHAHFSGAYSQSADENTTFDFKFWELGTVYADLTNADKDDIATRVWTKRPWNEEDPKSTAVAMQRDYDRIKATDENIRGLEAEVDNIATSIANLTTDNEEIKSQLTQILNILSVPPTSINRTK
jgi:hypothetical protein